MSICNKAHRYAEHFVGLPDSQADDGRHKCAGCAYELGLMAGLNNKTSDYSGIVHTLPGSQAGTVRHKDPEAAYNLGYKEGKKKYTGK